MTPKRKQLFAGLVIISVLCWFEWAVLECGRCEGASKRRVLDHNTAVFYFLDAYHEWCLRACIYNLHAVWRSRMTNIPGVAITLLRSHAQGTVIHASWPTEHFYLYVGTYLLHTCLVPHNTLDI